MDNFIGMKEWESSESNGDCGVATGGHWLLVEVVTGCAGLAFRTRSRNSKGDCVSQSIWKHIRLLSYCFLTLLLLCSFKLSSPWQQKTLFLLCRDFLRLPCQLLPDRGKLRKESLVGFTGSDWGQAVSHAGDRGQNGPQRGLIPFLGWLPWNGSDTLLDPFRIWRKLLGSLRSAKAS